MQDEVDSLKMVKVELEAKEVQLQRLVLSPNVALDFGYDLIVPSPHLGISKLLDILIRRSGNNLKSDI